MAWPSQDDWAKQFERNSANMNREFQINQHELSERMNMDIENVQYAANITVGVVLGLLLLLGIIVVGTTLYCWKKKRVTPGVVIRPPPPQAPPGSNTYPGQGQGSMA